MLYSELIVHEIFYRLKVQLRYYTFFFNGNITLFLKITSKHFVWALKLSRFRKTCMSCPKNLMILNYCHHSPQLCVNLFYYQMIQLQIFVMNFCNSPQLSQHSIQVSLVYKGGLLSLKKDTRNPALSWLVTCIRYTIYQFYFCNLFYPLSLGWEHILYPLWV